MNTNRFRSHLLGAVRLVWTVCLVAGSIAQAFTTAPVEIRLRAEAYVDHDLVVLSDVADILGGTLATRRQLGQIDLQSLTAPPAEVTIGQNQIAIRLKLAGFADSQFQLTGARRTRVTRAHASLDDTLVIQELETRLTEHWNLPPDSLEVRLLEPLQTALSKSRVESLPANVTIAPLLQPSDLPGRLRLRIGIYRADQLLHTVSLHIEALVQRPVTVAVRPLRARQVVVPEDVRVERRVVTGRMAIEPLTEAIGLTANRYVRAGNIVQASDLVAPISEQEAAAEKTQDQQAAEANEAPIRVKRKTPVQLVALGKGIRVTLAGAELIRDAQVGDMVQVLNKESKKVVTGQLVSPTRVEIKL